jgi:hypothetical protein
MSRLTLGGSIDVSLGKLVSRGATATPGCNEATTTWLPAVGDVLAEEVEEFETADELEVVVTLICGSSWPFQNKVNLFSPPHGSVGSPAHGVLQSLLSAGPDPAARAFPQKHS